MSKFRNADEAYAAGRHWLDRDCEPCEPTPFAPGTYEKLMVLRARYWAGQELHHPDDGAGDFRGTPTPLDGRPAKWP